VNDRELERRVSRWLNAQAAPAPASLRARVERIPLKRPVERRFAMPLVAAAAALVVVAVIVASVVLFNLGPQVGGRGCGPELIDRAKQALAGVDAYAYGAMGSVSVWHGKLDPSNGGAVYEPKGLQIDGGFEAPDRVRMTVTEGAGPPAPAYPPLLKLGFDSVIRIGGETWFRFPGTPTYGSPQFAGDLDTLAPLNPVRSLLQGRDELPNIRWTAEDGRVAGSGGCVLTGKQHDEDVRNAADEVGPETYVIVVRIPDSSGLPSRIRERLDYVAPALTPGTDAPRPAYIELDYEINYEGETSIEPPPP
jgi:hypothetical protein